jgi:hypothetical protein
MFGIWLAMVKILWYVAFLVWELGTTFLQGWLALRAVRQSGSLLNRRPVLIREISYFFTAVTIYVSVLLLARFSILLIAVIYFLGAQVEILTGIITGVTAVSDKPTRSGAETAWARTSGSLRHPFQALMTGCLSSTIIFVAYPAVAGIVYFSSTIPSTAASYAIVRVILAFTLIGNLAALIPTQTGIALSENLSNASRWRYFASLVAALVPIGILLATFLWTFSTSTARVTALSSSFYAADSVVILSIMAAYFLIALLLPNIIGALRSTQRQRQFLDLRKETLAKAIHILMTPIPDFYGRELEKVATELEKELKTIGRSDLSINVGLQLDRRQQLLLEQRQQITAPLAADVGNTPAYASDSGDKNTSSLPSLARSGPASEAPPSQSSGAAPDPATLRVQALLKNFDDRNYYLARRWNPRFQQIDWLSEEITRLRMTASDLMTKSDDARVSAAVAWASSYKEDRHNLIEAASETKSDTLGAVIITTVVTTVASVFFTSFGSWLWAHVAHTLPK